MGMAAALVSLPCTEAFLRAWKLVRLASDAGSFCWPSANILADGHACGERGVPPAQLVQDAERVQAIVEEMPGKVRVCFEAYHLGIVPRLSVRETEYARRWLGLGVSRRTYYRRAQEGRRVVRERLSY